MIEGIEFSDRGQMPTEFELRLLERASGSAAWVMVGKRLIAEFGREIGAKALAVVLDEVGGEKPHIPHRRHLFEALWREERDLLIVDLASRDDWSFAAIGRALGVSRVYVKRLADRANATAADDRSCARMVTTRP